jgi:hypothetical protein
MSSQPGELSFGMGGLDVTWLFVRYAYERRDLSQMYLLEKAVNELSLWDLSGNLHT